MKNTCSQRGFTLLEIIVVIVLFSLIITLAMQGISYVLGQRARMALYQQEIVSNTLHHQWFMESVSSLYIPPENNKYIFIGKPNNFKGISLTPLIAPEFSGDQIVWSLIEDDGLIKLNYYQVNPLNNDSPEQLNIKIPDINLLALDADNAYFRYIDEQGDSYPAWPPTGTELKSVRYNTLPDAIYLHIAAKEPSKNVDWFVRLSNEKNTKISERLSE